jgi:recombination protein RecA
VAKKAQQEEVVESPDSFTDRIFDQVEKDYGEGVLVAGEDAVNEKRQIIPWTPTLDIITSGGIEEGSWVGITGHEKTGKTTAALTFAANAQRPEFGSRRVFYDKVEGRLSMSHLQGIKGLDLRRGRFDIIQSRKGLILSQKDHLTILRNLLNTVENCVVIIDSISAYCTETELNEGVGTETRGGGAKQFAQWCRMMNQVVPVNKNIVIGITQLISNTSGMGAQYQERAARMWKYQCDFQLRTIMKTAWKVGETQIGLNVKWACNTSKLGPPGMTIESFLRFGVGFDKLFEVINLGMAAGLIQKGGAWLTLSFLEKPAYKHLLGGAAAPKKQGTEKIYELLEQQPEWAAALEKEVLALAGGLVGSE